jgi:hypothetical protein
MAQPMTIKMQPTSLIRSATESLRRKRWLATKKGNEETEDRSQESEC